MLLYANTNACGETNMQGKKTKTGNFIIKVYLIVLRNIAINVTSPFLPTQT